jgi:hypothetical protein
VARVVEQQEMALVEAVNRQQVDKPVVQELQTQLLEVLLHTEPVDRAPRRIQIHLHQQNLR